MATHTHCPYCALQCAMRLAPAGRMAVPAGTASAVAETGTTAAGPAPAGTVLEAAGRDFPTNRGGLCRKGWTSPTLLNSPERLTTPLLRGADGELHPVGWDAALDRAAGAVRAAWAAYGTDAVGVFGSGGLTNEKAYQLGKFARLALRTSRIDYNGRFCMSSAAAAGNRAFGLDRGLPFPLADLDNAHTVLLLGSNVADTMPPFVAHLQGTRDAGGLIVVDPRRSATAALTGGGTGLHLQPSPGTDLALLLGIAHVVVQEGLADKEFIQRRTAGYRSVARSLNAWWPERVQAVTGVPAELVRETARRLAEGARRARAGLTAGGSYILTGRGVEQHVDGTDTATAAINLSLLLGLPGTTHSGYGTLTGQGNGQGGREHGQKSDQLPGYRKITDPAAREHVAAVWGIAPDQLPGPGLPAVELLKSLGRPGGVRCLFVHGSNIAVSAPDAGRVLAGLRSLDFLMVADFVLSETAAEADLVLPVLQWAEEEGTMTNLEGRVLRRRRAVTPPEGARSELWIMQELAARLGAPSMFSDNPETIFEELRRASAGGPADYSGIDYGILDDDSVPAYWPFPAGSAGTPRLFLEAFAHADGRARFTAVSPGDTADALHRPGELTLVTGRLLEHYQSGAQTRRVAELSAAQPEPRLQLHPATALPLGIGNGDMAEISNHRGTVRARAELSTDIRPDTVFLPFHFAGEQSANLLTQAATDPVSGMPEFKTSAVQVRVLEKAGSR
ncbi:molybdopterin oxidoreductase family protein [Arthrobacter sp. I2-34]|uniref:Molybdopterin oxidoreductase family protein n=2 Tax=Arthrobacter hankyongi TaxID=2904801 RepID=A0ABS9L5R3_9MICC|nr:molybdopterin oxidoreductase family protein [Arthrobacter hankyongi]MCG2621928.1 molybdopterin oxidoreductase family protein [Arthrobacter hankyongi]